MAQYCMMIMMAFSTLAGVAAVSLRKSSCACKNFKETYQNDNNNISCGAGQEWNWVPKNASEASEKYKRYVDPPKKGWYCKRVWLVLDTDRCVNLNVGTDNGTWCYVDSACKDLNGGSEINDNVSWKVCSQKDLKLRDYTPDELFDFAQKHDIAFGALQKLSYPGSRAGERQLAKVDEFNGTVPDWVLSDITKFGDSNVPYWFDTNENATLPVMIVYGSKAYTVEYGLARDPQHPNTSATLNCTMGC